MNYPHFVTLVEDIDNEDTVTLLVRLEDDRDFFPWGKITTQQRDVLETCGVFELGSSMDEDES